MAKGTDSRLWYTRRGEEIRGPFPEGLIRRYVLLGRIRSDDEVSVDSTHWQTVSQVSELIPSELNHVGTVAELERLQLVRRHADEREAGNRRANRSIAAANKRRGGERRRDEPESELAHREARDEAFAVTSGRGLVANYPRVVVFLALVGVLAYGAWHFGGEGRQAAPDCDTLPAVGINWSSCKKEGADLAGLNLLKSHLRGTRLTGADLSGTLLNGSDRAYAQFDFANLSNAALRDAKLTGANLQSSNLSGADLTNSDLSYADLRKAELTGVSLVGAKLGKAIWLDGRTCAPGSVGRCQ